MDDLKEYSFAFTQEDMNIILEGLGELKAKISMGLMQKIGSQYAKQVKKQQDEVEE